MLVHVRTSVALCQHDKQNYGLYQLKIDVGMLKTEKII